MPDHRPAVLVDPPPGPGSSDGAGDAQRWLVRLVDDDVRRRGAGVIAKEGRDQANRPAHVALAPVCRVGGVGDVRVAERDVETGQVAVDVGDVARIDQVG